MFNDMCMKIMEMILKLSPIGVFCLLCPVVAENGPAVLGSLAKVLLVPVLLHPRGGGLLPVGEAAGEYEPGSFL